MESQSTLDWGCLPWVLLRYLYQRFHSLRGHQQSVEAEECGLQSLPEVFPRLEVWLLPKFGLEVLLAELGALKASVAIEDGE